MEKREMMPRAYVNLEKAQIETILELFKEINETRGLKAVEKFILLILKEELDKLQSGW